MFGSKGKEIESGDNKEKDKSRTVLNLEKSKNLAENSGYELVPKHMLSETWNRNQVNSIGAGEGRSISVTNTNLNEIWDNVTYVKDGPVSDSNFKVLQDKDLLSGFYQVTSETRSYSNPSTLSKAFEVIKNVGEALYPDGNTNTNVFFGWLNYPKDGNLNRFKNNNNTIYMYIKKTILFITLIAIMSCTQSRRYKLFRVCI